MESQQFLFPKGFLWGAATSAHQVEGNHDNDWTEWEKEGHPISGHACDHYNRFREDFDIARSLGHNAHRFSLEWSRIEPQEGIFDEKEIAHYREVIAALRERGMEPFVTLWHWTLPLWMRDKGGVASREFPRFFARFAERMAKEYKDDARFWITINEPMIWTTNAYLRGIWPPQKKSVVEFFHVVQHLIKAHRQAYRSIHAVYANKQKGRRVHVGIAKNNSFFEGWAAPLVRWFWNHWFLNRIADRHDFIGLNYYFHNHIKGLQFNQNESKDVSDMGWEIYPEGIYHVLCDLKKYHKPIYITENGIADAKDVKRTDFIRDHLRFTLKALRSGADVRGYFYWSLLDNFEWDKGFDPRFGLVEMDYQTMERHIRPSARAYCDIIQTNGSDL